MSSLTLNSAFLDKCATEYDIELNPYIFDTMDFLRSEYADPQPVVSEEEIVQIFKTIANQLRRLHITNEALRAGKDPDYTRGRTFKFDLDEIGMIIHAFIPIVQLSMTENAKKFELAVYQLAGPYQGTYQFDIRLIETIIYTLNPTTTKQQLDTCLRIIDIKAKRTYESKNIHLIPVGNGLYNRETQQLEDFNPDFITTTKIATDYNPDTQLTIIHNDNDGTDWNVEDWLKDLAGGLINQFDPDIHTLFWQIIASAIDPKQVNAKAIFFYSAVGNNGKGTYGQLLKNLVGKENYSSLPIQAFKHEYMKEQLLNKTLNIADENPVDIYLDSVQDFKAVITGDDILINRKFEKPIAVQIKAINIQMLNGFPKTRDKTDSFYRRLIIVPFVYSFTNNGERAYIKHDYIHRQEVLEYVLKKALEMPTFSEFITPVTSIEALEEYKEDNNSAIEFWNEFENQFTWTLLPQNFLYKLYLAWYEDEHGGDKRSCFSKKTFLYHLENYLTNNPKWDFKATRKTCPSPLYVGSHMSPDEPLISQYNLTDYMDLSYKGSDEKLRRAFTRPRTARGIIKL